MADTNTSPVTPRPDDFHIGLTMAGAASAGCYTAGVMDYLFEILDLWQRAKEGKLEPEWDSTIYKLVPPHNVTIDVMGGTSAGGMTTIMAAIYAIKGNINPVKDPGEKHCIKGNIFYDSWVLMGDGAEKGKPEKKENLLFERTLHTRDLADTGKIQSLLNSDFIDSICDGAFADDVPVKKRPAYISPGLEVLLSHTMLRSVPLAVNFSTPFGNLKKNGDKPEHNTFDHFTVSHFKLNYEEAAHKDKYLPLDPFGPANATMKLATKATGAFPIGLRFREFFNQELSSAYMKNLAERIVFKKQAGAAGSGLPPLEWPKNFPDPFHFVGVDGGAVNNEPFGEVLSVLKEKQHQAKQATGMEYHYGLVMIDPFPDLVPAEKYEQPDDLFTIVPAIIHTLWDQAKVKRAEVLEACSGNFFRSEIYPKRYSYNEKEKKYKAEDHPIACGAAMAFSGFLDIDFRRHDFFLGRDNARNFFKTYFSFEYDKENNIIHPIHQGWTEEMREAFKFKREGKFFLPIIPNMYLLRDKLLRQPQNPFEHIVAEWPQYDPEKLFSMKRHLNKRVKKMLELAYKKSKGSAKSKEVKETNPEEAIIKASPEATAWLNKYYRSNFFGKVGGWIGGGVTGLAFWLMKGKIAKRITKAAFEWILKDLEAKGLLMKKK